MATNITIDETITNVSISGVAETTPEYTTITLSNDQGAQGPTGATGATGPANTLSIGTVTGGASASATITGTAPAQTLNLTLPKGDTGNTGPANSLSIGTVSEGTAAATITGTAPSQTLNLTVPKGNTGTAATIAVGTVTTGAAGSSATVTNSGSSSAATFDFSIPQGNTGATGQGYTARGTYAGGTAYVPYDAVYFDGNSYRCKANTTGNSPTNTTYWELLTLGYSAQGAYSSGTTYNQGNTVSYLGGSYYCFSDGTLNKTPTNTTYWQVIGAKGDTGATGATGATGSVAPTFWYSPSANYTTGTLTALTAVDPFGLTNGVTVVNSKTYFVDYLITGSIASTGSTSASLRLTMAGDAVSNFNFATSYSGALSATPNFNWTSANDYEAFINATTSNFQVGGTIASSGTAQVFQLRFTGILRTSASGSYFQPKIALSAVSGTTITVNRESFASLLEIGTSATTSLGTWS